MAASGAAEVVADSDQVVDDSLPFDFHSMRVEILGREVGVGNVVGQVKAFNGEIDQPK